MSRLNIPGFIKLFSVTFLFLMVSFVTIGTFTGFCTEQEISTLEAVEVKDDTDEGPTEITLSEVNKAREVSRIRVYGLIALWAVIVLCVYLVNLQRKDDERLYQDGYYSKDDE
jgi:hypothetical protein